MEGEVFGWGQDHYHLEPVVNGAQENMKAIGKGEDYLKDTILDRRYGISLVVRASRNARKKKLMHISRTKTFGKGIRDLKQRNLQLTGGGRGSAAEDFSYDEAADVYECPMGKRLKLQHR